MVMGATCRKMHRMQFIPSSLFPYPESAHKPPAYRNAYSVRMQLDDRHERILAKHIHSDAPGRL